MSLIDLSIARVRRAVRESGKKPLADLAEIDDTILGGCESDAWNPTAKTLRKLERAIGPLKPEDVPRAKSGHRDYDARNPDAPRRSRSDAR